MVVHGKPESLYKIAYDVLDAHVVVLCRHLQHCSPFPIQNGVCLLSTKPVAWIKIICQLFNLLLFRR
jgi:hypothetical protein